MANRIPALMILALAMASCKTATEEKGKDAKAPSAPTNLAAAADGDSLIKISFSASKDNVEVEKYKIESCKGSGCKDFKQTGTTDNLKFNHTGLEANTLYRYRVRAVDAAGNHSPYSNVASATTLADSADKTPPAAPATLVATAVSASGINLSYAAATDNVKVTKYLVERCLGKDCVNFAQVAAPVGNTHGDTGLNAETLYRYRVRASDAAGNLSPYSPVASATTAKVVASGYPDASNTGVLAGVTLKKFTGTYYVTQDNAVVDGLEVRGAIIVEAKNVTLKNIRLYSETPWHALQVQDGATGFKLMDSELYGAATGTVNGVLGFGTFLRNEFQGFDNAINTWSDTVIRDNFIHKMAGNEDSHFDGIEINGGENIQIIHNTVINEKTQTSAIMLNNYFMGIAKIVIDDNYLVGGGYTVYLDHRFGGGAVDNSTIKITNNKMGKGYYGYFALYGNNPTVSGNFDDKTGKPVN